MASQIAKNLFEPKPAAPGETGAEWMDPNHLFEVTLPDGTKGQMTYAQLMAVQGQQVPPPAAPPALPAPAQVAGGIAGQQIGQSAVRGLTNGGPISGLPPAAPNIVPPPAAINPGLGASAFDPNFNPSQYLAEGGNGMQLPNQLGINGPTYAASQVAQLSNPTIWNAGSDAAAMGTNIASGLEGLGVGAETAGSIGGALGTGLPIAGGLYGGYQLFKNLSDNQKDPLGGAMAGAGTGAAIGSVFPGIGTLIGAGAGGLLGAVAGSFGGNKDKDQLHRDSMRKNLMANGFIGPDYKLNLADGTSFDIGKDGHYKMDNGLHPYQVDFGQEGASDIVGAVNPLAALIAKGNSKLTSDFAGYFTNAILQSKDKQKNLLGLYQQAGLDRDSALQMIQDLKVDDATKAAYSSAVDTVFRNKPLQHADPALVAAAPHFQNGVQTPQVKPQAPAQPTPQPGPIKDPNVHQPRTPVNTSTVQQPVPKRPTGGGLSLSGWQRPGMMANNPPTGHTLFGKR